MGNKVEQIYEQYWRYTAAWTDIHGNNFIDGIKICVEYFKSHKVKKEYSNKDYEKLQDAFCRHFGYDKESARKSINQFVKLGFVKPLMQGVYPEAFEYANAKNDSQRTVYLSKAVYKHANFQNSMAKNNPQWDGQMQFLIKTLLKCQKLTKNDLIGLMTYDYSSQTKEHLTKEELENLYNKAVSIGFDSRKHVQIRHLMKLLNNLDNLRIRKGVIYFEEDAKALFGDEDEQKSLSKYRDQYLQREYKKELIAECNGRCMVENVDYPVLIASHIRPYKDCRDKKDWNAAFDVNNGLLLSKNLDSLFDLGYITFDKNGDIVTSDELSQDVKDKLKPLKLNTNYINSERIKYLKIHRKLVFNKRFKKRIVI